MVRSYLRHGPTQAFGIITSPTSNSHYDSKLAYVPGWEDVLVWDLKRGEMVSMWHSTGHTAPVTQICASPNPLAESSEGAGGGKVVGVGYQDGAIRVWEWSGVSGEEAVEVVTFNGHKKAVVALAYDAEGTRLASGGLEGEIIIWDTVGEVGLFRLRSHQGPITTLNFIPHPTEPSTTHPGYLLSTSKDTFLKLWDLSTQHCIQTIVVSRAEVRSCSLRSYDGHWMIVAGTGDGEVKLFSIDQDELAKGMAENAQGELPSLITSLGPLTLPTPLPTTASVSQLAFHPTLPFLMLQSSDKALTILRIRDLDEVAQKKARRRKRDREKGREVASGDKGEAEEESTKFDERITSWCVVRAGGKIRSFAFGQDDSVSGPRNAMQVLLALSNNALETHAVPLPGSSKPSKTVAGTEPEPSKTHSLELHGHRQDVRTMCLSSDDQVLATASNGTLKIWNLKTTACIRTMECSYAICSTFLPGDRHVVVGTKEGKLLLYDVAASSLIATIDAHDGPVWGIHVRPDGQALVSGSADKDVKFWEFEMRESGGGETVVSRLGVETVNKTKQLTLVHVRTLKMTDDVLAVKFSPDNRFLAVSLLDSTVKVFFQDTLKFFLSLYGHKLPVLSLDISSDSKLIATCSADKNVKIWGLDFGDCHKSIFAHDESIMQVAFERDSHYFWTVGKDRSVKYWDGDKFELIQKLDGHHGEIWALAVSNAGEFVVSGSHDKSIRVWEKTEEPLFLEEERERELEELYDSNLADTLNREDGEQPEADSVQKQTSETLMAGEKIMEALELADADRAATREWQAAGADPGAQPSRNPELLARGNLAADEYVLQVLQKIPAAGMEDALLVLPFQQVVSLLEYLDEWARASRDITLTSRILFFLLRTHHHQIVANRVMRTPLVALRQHLRAALKVQRETIGYNMAALRFIKNRYEAERTASLYEEEGWDEDKVRERIEEGKGKRKRVQI